MLRNTFFVAVTALVLAGCNHENPLGGIFGGTVEPIKVTSPNGGEIWLQGDTETITWEAISLTADNVTIDYSTDGVDWTNVATVLASANSYDWTVPNDNSKLCRVRVMEKRSGGQWDDSDADFRITPPVVEVTSPNGGEFWLVGDTETITWIAAGATATDVDIDYNAGAGWQVIATVPIAPGSYDWVVPNDPSTTCVVRVQESGGGLTDQSDADFSITLAFILVTSPNLGTETWGIGMQYDITWNSAGVGNVEIDYSTDGGATYTDRIATVSAATGSYTWTVPDDANTQCRVRVQEPGGSGLSDESDADFTIVVPIEVTSPIGGEVWDLGVTPNITWASVGLTNVRIELFRNGAWEDLEATVADTGTYAWNIIGAPAADALIRLSDVATGTYSDQSDAPFTMRGIMVTAPNGGEIVTVGSDYVITWTSAGLTADVRIRYSDDSGATYPPGNPIVATTPVAAGTYTWTSIAVATGTTYRVQVRDTGGSGLDDDSDADFEIQ